MKILVLDDEDARHEAFKEKFKNHDVHHVYTVDGAVTKLQENESFDVAFLDHDLNDFNYKSMFPGRHNSRVELNGVDVASFIARVLSAEKRPKMVVVHSRNPPGAENMAGVLRDAGVQVHKWEFNPRFKGVDFVW